MTKRVKAQISILALVAISLCQLVTTVAAHADPPAGTSDLSLEINSNLTIVPPGRYIDFPQYAVQVCNDGTDDIESFTFDATIENLDLEGYVVDTISLNYWHNSVEVSPASTRGSVSNVGVWSGLLQPTQCVMFYPTGTITRDVGEFMTASFELTSSVVVGGGVNNDSEQSNDFDEGYDVEIVSDYVDLTIDARLLTEGTITPSTNVEYGLTVSNIGNVDDPSWVHLINFVIPEQSTLVEVVDVIDDDEFYIDQCQELGLVSGFLSDPDRITDGMAIQCDIGNTTNVFPAGDSYDLILNIVAGSNFSSGSASAFGMVFTDTNEFDSGQVLTQFFQVLTGGAVRSNNLVSLDYDPGELTAEINRCEGQANPTLVDEACFSIVFNKPIWSPSFTQSDLELNGQGNIYLFEKYSNTFWNVYIDGMKLDETIELTLIPDSVIDLSAVQGALVLGENTIRYASTNNDNSGSPGGGSGSTGSTGGSGTGNTPKSTNPPIATTTTTAAITTTVPDNGEASGSIDDDAKVDDANVKEDDSNPFTVFGLFSLTGANILIALLIVLILLAAGFSLFLMFRRRRSEVN